MENFVIFSLARCGSNALADIINICTPQSCLYEPFNHQFGSGRYLHDALYNSLDYALEQIWASGRGFKHIWNHDGWPFPSRYSDFNAALCSAGKYQLVLLSRRNILKRVISEEVARQSTVWRTGSQESYERRANFKFSEVNIDHIRRQLEREITALEEFRCKLKAASQPWLDLKYEDLFGKRKSSESALETLRNVLFFLGVSRDRVDAAFPLLSSALLSWQPGLGAASVYRKIPNFPAIEALGNDQVGYLFSDD